MKRHLSCTPALLTGLLIAVICPGASDAEPRERHVPSHIETWVGYHYADREGNASPMSTLRNWATFVDGASPYSFRVCNIAGHPCNSVVYVNFTSVYFGKCGWSDAVFNGGLTQRNTLAESAWLHASSIQTYTNRLFSKYSERCFAATPNTGFWTNAKSITGPGNARGWFDEYFQREWRDAIPDYYMADDTSVINDFGGRQAYEYRSWSDVQHAQAAFLGGVTNKKRAPQKLFFNGCNRNTYITTGVSLIRMSPNIVGCINENLINTSDMANGRDIYALDNCARVTLSRNGGIFVNGPNGEGRGVFSRRQATAFQWLCYVPGRVIDWEEEDWNYKFANVYPEEGLYVTRPLQSMSLPRGCPDETIPPEGPGINGTSGEPCRIHGHNDLVVPGTSSVLRREFAACYNRGVYIGGCAVIWNMGSAPVTIGSRWLQQRYHRTIEMASRDSAHGTIDDGGALLFPGVAPTGRSISPYDALLLVQ